ncbi:MAG: RagB/SusD family nutrient uptake outer membrane protein [Tannerellaceae bacterium]|nr:RagB/SusD family nutrient uptake outer membrane protein [Tannerellaceae bacterium]
MKKIIISMLSALALISFSACESYLDVTPDDQITDAIFWQTPEDADLAINGCYASLRSYFLYGYGPGLDACTPNAYQWANWETYMAQVGNGTITPTMTLIVPRRWQDCYQLIYRTNYLFENIDKIPDFDAATKERIIGEAYFLRGVAYDLLSRSYGGVPIVTKVITPAESKELVRSTVEQSWEQAHADFDEAIKRLPKDAKNGQATLGAAYGMKMKAYLYTSQWDKVLEYCNKIDELNKYSLYPTYYGLFQPENEGNAETLFAVSFMGGPNSQGSCFDRYFQPQNLKYGMDGSNSTAPTQLLVDEYETIDGSPVDPANPYENRDPRLDFTVLRPGAYFQGQLYPDEIKNHTGQQVAFGIRKYTIETRQVVEYQSDLDFMVLRYGDVLLCRAEALLETNGSVDEAIDIINRIRTEREDVKIKAIAKGLSREEARKALRHERRVELALEGQFWDDIKRWNAGPEYYPCDVIGALGQKIETKFANGYDISRDNLIPISSNEISINPNITQNPGY